MAGGGRLQELADEIGRSSGEAARKRDDSHRAENDKYLLEAINDAKRLLLDCDAYWMLLNAGVIAGMPALNEAQTTLVEMVEARKQHQLTEFSCKSFQKKIKDAVALNTAFVKEQWKSYVDSQISVDQRETVEGIVETLRNSSDAKTRTNAAKAGELLREINAEARTVPTQKTDLQKSQQRVGKLKKQLDSVQQNLIGGDKNLESFILNSSSSDGFLLADLTDELLGRINELELESLYRVRFRSPR